MNEQPPELPEAENTTGAPSPSPSWKSQLQKGVADVKSIAMDLKRWTGRNPRWAAGAAALVCFAMVIKACVPDSGMPEVSKLSKSSFPAAVEKVARRVFDERFSLHDGSHYTLIVHYLPNVQAEIEESPFLAMMGSVLGMDGGAQSRTTRSAVVFLVDLVEIKGLRTEVTQRELTEADRLNGITWKGDISVRGRVERRRQLELADWVQEVLAEKPDTPMPWAATPITLEIPVSTADNPQTMVDAIGRMMGAFTGDGAVEHIRELIQSGPWRDWVDCGEAVYQQSRLELRDGQTTVSSTEDILEALKGQSTFTLLAFDPKNFLYLNMLSEDRNMAFLTRPNMAALRKAKVLK